MSEINDYISGLSGKEIDAAILLILQKFVKSFNGRSGFDVKPERGDYKTDMILDGSARPEGYGFPEDIVPLDQILVKIYNILVKIHEHQLKPQYHRDLLLGDKTRFENGTYTLNKNWTDYQYLEFWLDQGSNGGPFGNENTVFYLPVDFIKIFNENSTNRSNNFLIYGYSGEYIDVGFPAENQITQSYISGQRFFRLYGIKFAADFDGFTDNEQEV